VREVDSDAKCNTCNLLVQRKMFDLAPRSVAAIGEFIAQAALGSVGRPRPRARRSKSPNQAELLLQIDPS
jgi:hypothetical protein